MITLWVALCVHWTCWKPRVFIMPTLSSLVAPQVVIMTTWGAASDNKVGIITALSLVYLFTSSSVVGNLFIISVHQSVKAPGDCSSMILLCCQKINNATWDSSWNCHDYTPSFNAVERGYTSFTLSVAPFVRLWTESYPLCIFNNTRQIHFISAHLIKTSEGVSRVKFVSKFENLKFWQIF